MSSTSRSNRDDDGIQRTEVIEFELKRAIQESRISIVVFSKNYAFSTWCLDELVTIVEHNTHSEQGDYILPIFYDVNPSDFRKQTSTVGEAFSKHKSGSNDESKLMKWKEALIKVANIAGMPFNSKSDRYESDFIKETIKVVATKFPPRELVFSDFEIVGVDHYIQAITHWLDKSTSTNILVIHGIKGIGKTTIADLIYRGNIRRFEGGSFLKISTFSKDENGTLKLQARFLSDILPKIETKEPCTILDGWDKIKRVLRSRRVLLVLDDLDQSTYSNDIIDQLKKLLTEGSKVIITTWMNLALPFHLEKVEISGLSNEDSLKLFRLHAFRQNHPKKDYEKLETDLVHYCQGHPLALKVMGRCLSRKSRLDQWEDQLRKLKETSHKEISDILKVSYDSLEDNEVRSIFLDMACFLVGKERDVSMTFLKGCYAHVDIGIGNLIDLCLLEVYENIFTMHNLIQSMGYRIVSESSKRYPEKCSRLWIHKDALQVLKDKTGTKYIEGLTLDMRNLNTQQDLESDAIERMQKLRILYIDYAEFSGSCKVPQRTLKWLSWKGYSLKSKPNNFILEGLLILDMSYSKLQCLWEKEKYSLGSLKILNLSHCHLLEKISDFTKMLNLEKLFLKNCKRLVTIDASIWNLDKLTVLDMEGCKSLRKLPKSEGIIKSVKRLVLSGCSNLVEGLEMLAMMTSLVECMLDGINMGRSTSSTEESGTWIVQRIQKLIMWPIQQERLLQINPLVEALPRHLKHLSLVSCGLSEDDIPLSFGNLRMLEELDLAGNLFHHIPENNPINNLSRLTDLTLNGCPELQSIYTISGSLGLRTRKCPSLVIVNSDSASIYVSGQGEQCHVEYGSATRYIGELDAEAWNTIPFINLYSMPVDTMVMFSDGVFEVNHEDESVKHPEWIDHKSTHCHTSFVIPSSPKTTFRGFILILISTAAYVHLMVINKTKNLYQRRVAFLQTTPVWLSYWLFGIKFENGDHIEILSKPYYNSDEVTNHEYGIRLVVDENHEKEIHNFQSTRNSSFPEYIEVDKYEFFAPKGFFHGRFRIKIPWHQIDEDQGMQYESHLRWMKDQPF